jgi:methylglyoxal synthase
VDKQEMVNLREEMKELANQLKLVASSQVSEVIQQKVNTMIGKIDSLIEDIVGKRG